MSGNSPENSEDRGEAQPESEPRSLWLVDDPLFDRHHAPGYHPERPERLHAARVAIEATRASGVSFTPLDPVDATDEELTKVHEPAYLAELASRVGRSSALDDDTYVGPDSVAAARRAAGGAIALARTLVDRGGAGVALLRPPGHHARPSRGMGFCLLNNVALAAAHALARGIGKVAIVDFDVHHGNGTQDAFYDDPRVLFVSLHQYPFYPGTGSADQTGSGEGRGTTVNVPLSQGATDATYDEAFRSLVLPVLDDFAPELLLVSAGFDAHARDPLAQMNVTAAGYASMTRSLAATARRHAKGRIGLVLEGGYDIEAVSTSLESAIRGLEDVSDEPATDAPPISLRHGSELARARDTQREFWKL